MRYNGFVFPKSFELEISSVSTDGAGVGVFNNHTVAVFGAIPGDVVLVEPRKVSHSKSKAALLSVLKPSKDRIDYVDEHYPSSSPWQVLKYDTQLECKKALVQKLFNTNTHSSFRSLHIQPALEIEQYRNKIEYTFFKNENGEIDLGFKKRFRRRECYLVTSSIIAPGRIHEVSGAIRDSLRLSRIDSDFFKTLIVRYSFLTHTCIAGLFVTKENVSINVPDIQHLSGIHVVYSNPQSPASVISKIISSVGDSLISERVCGVELQYPWSGFFQQNIKTFELLCMYVSTFLSQKDELVDMYSGVGTLGIVLAAYVHSVISIEQSGEMSRVAQKNAEKNAINNISFFQSESEDIHALSYIHNDSVVLIDPPRSGVHPRVIEVLKTRKPKRIIYVSCNPKTQSRDVRELMTYYSIIGIKLFDLYPHTPHVESVLILECK